ncbi:hypothetical protein WA026_009819 [Henosepilachna vigintioctopunctata]|uniref:Major facilitator superfamily associated domain-containing protein n=1 Tax=Henosepilachna vigintioctopunctata TaxID=420089 RepID=A0AAW1TRV8_9CUCU
MIVKKLLPIKAHYFFFLAALGPILPQLQVFGRELGISSVVMGSVTGILPFVYLLAKPFFGMVVDIHREYRKCIFMGLIVIMAVSYGCIIFIPLKSAKFYEVKVGEVISKCERTMNNNTIFEEAECVSENSIKLNKFQLYFPAEDPENISICSARQELNAEILASTFKCRKLPEVSIDLLSESLSFWFFIAQLSIGTVAFNVINSISDAVCFDVIGDEYDYGKQRTWGAVGYGIAAIVSGYAMDFLPHNFGGYRAAIFIMLLFIILDLVSCLKLKLPIIPAPDNIWKELAYLLKHNDVCIFLIFTIISGVADGFLTYFLLWYVEDISELSGTKNIKFLEGLIIAAQTFGGGILFFYIGDNIKKKLGHINCFSLCFLCYALRLFLISIASPWVIIAIEFFLQGPTFSLSYLTIVAYANDIASAGTSATMQGIAAGLDDGLGYALGSLIGGILYRFVGASQTFQIFGAISALAAISHFAFTNGGSKRRSQ